MTPKTSQPPTQRPRPYQQLSPEEKAVALSEAEKNRAATALSNAKLIGEGYINEAKKIALAQALREEQTLTQVDFNNRIYDLSGVIDDDSVTSCQRTLAVWTRSNDNPIKIRIHSPGGSVIDGFALYDFIQDIAARDKNGELLGPDADPNTKASGVFITSFTWGMAASMAGVLLQAGNRRVAAPNAWVLVHGLSSFKFGNYTMDEEEDRLRFQKMLQERLHEILTAKSTITVQEIKDLTTRRDYWMPAREVLEHGLVDAIGYK